MNIFDQEKGPNQELSVRVSGAVCKNNKGVTLPKALEVEPHHWIQFSVIPKTQYDGNKSKED